MKTELKLSMKKLFRDEEGITTIGMSVSIFLCIALIFTSAQLYRISSASAEIQEVADASALAADNEVAEFVAAVNVCDAADKTNFTWFLRTFGDAAAWPANS